MRGSRYKTDEERAAARRQSAVERLARLRAERRASGLVNRTVDRQEPPPAHVLHERERALAAPASPFGDPPPGRSALDRKRGIGA
jgi:hypothetical protein